MPWPHPCPLMVTVEAGYAVAGLAGPSRAAGPARTSAKPSAASTVAGRRRASDEVSDTVPDGTGATRPIGCMPPQSRRAGAPVHCTAVRVDQVIPSLASRDAIGVHTLNLRDGLRAAGIDSDVYYGRPHPGCGEGGAPGDRARASDRDRWLLYQASIGSPVFDILAARSEPKLVNYHDITPAELLRDWEPAVAYEVALGRTQLARLAPQSRFAVADSAFNESELLALGYEGTAVVPLLIDMHAKSDDPDPVLAESLARRKERQGGADLLYVGKISPHKAPHDLVKMLDVLRRTDDPQARLHMVARRSARPTSRRSEPSSRSSAWSMPHSCRAR